MDVPYAYEAFLDPAVNHTHTRKMVFVK